MLGKKVGRWRLNGKRAGSKLEMFWRCEQTKTVPHPHQVYRTLTLKSLVDGIKNGEMRLRRTSSFAL
jgi:hypothetical protein